jgi:hypothetical protein
MLSIDAGAERGSEFTVLSESVEHFVEILDRRGGVVDGIEHGLHVGAVKFPSLRIAPRFLRVLPNPEEFMGETDESALAVIEAHGDAEGWSWSELATGGVSVQLAD